jgi:hypothetical protein
MTKIINILYNKAAWSRIWRIGIKGPNLVLVGTRHDLQFNNYPYQQNQVIYTHTRDYDQMHYIIDKPKTERKDIIFIDQYLPFHPETQKLKINPQDYYNGILQFLYRLSETTNRQVLFAAHPSSDRTLLEQYVPPQMIIYGETLKRIYNAYLAVSLCSTTMLSAYVSGTPILFLTCKNNLPIQFEEATAYLKVLLQAKSLDISDEFTRTFVQEIIDSQPDNNKSIFDEYVKHPNSEDLPEYEIIAKEVKNYLNQMNQL